MILPYAHAVAALLVAIALLRAIFLLGWRKPVAARICGSDLSEMQRAYDAFERRMARFDGGITPADNPFRSVTVRVGYRVDGRDYRADVRQWLGKGERPDASLLIWYDPKHPQRVTANGLGICGGLLLGAGVIVASTWLLPI